MRQPAIVLLNPQHVGSLLAEPIDENQKRSSEYWQQRAVIYIMSNLEICHLLPLFITLKNLRLLF